MSKKFALLIGTDQYEDPGFSPLTVLRTDVESLCDALVDPKIGGFDKVVTLMNAQLIEIVQSIGQLFAGKNEDDLLLLYFSGHAAWDAADRLHLAVAKTNPKLLSTTALSITQIQNEMNQSQSRRQVFILDCCYTSAFSRIKFESKPESTQSVLDENFFDAHPYGREILVSSSEAQRFWKGNKITGQCDEPLFTHFLAQGLQSGEAAGEGEHGISVGRLFDYARDKVVEANPAATPKYWVDRHSDSIILAQAVHEPVGTTAETDRASSSLADDTTQPTMDIPDGSVNKPVSDVSKSESKVSKFGSEWISRARDAIDKLINAASLKKHSRSGGEKDQASTAHKHGGGFGKKVHWFVGLILLCVAYVFFKFATHQTASPISREPGTVFQETLKSGSKGPAMVVIPAGSFLMGSPKNESGHNEDEGPQRRVNIGQVFALGQYEVTVGEFRKFILDSGYRTRAETGNGCFSYQGKWKLVKDANWNSRNVDQTTLHPVVCVTWADSQAYIDWLNEQTNSTAYRLPTESEWAYAVRAQSNTSRPWGTDPSEACKYGNVADKTFLRTYLDWAHPIHDCEDGYIFAAPVGQFKKNKFGLYDMIGNVWEWTEDTWHDNYESAPIDGSAWVDNQSQVRVLRGGAWDVGPHNARSANRFKYFPWYSYTIVGFRVARDL